MAERKITNNTMLLFMGTDGTNYDTVVCLTSVTRSLKRGEVDASTFCGPDKSPGQLSGTVAFEGQHLLDVVTGKVSGTALSDYLLNKTTIYWKIGVVYPVTGDVTYFGQGFLNSLDDSYKFDAQSTFSGTISIKGTPTKTITS
jgi:hypothetical protein